MKWQKKKNITTDFIGFAYAPGYRFEHTHIHLKNHTKKETTLVSIDVEMWFHNRSNQGETARDTKSKIPNPKSKWCHWIHTFIRHRIRTKAIDSLDPAIPMNSCVVCVIGTFKFTITTFLIDGMETVKSVHKRVRVPQIKPENY